MNEKAEIIVKEVVVIEVLIAVNEILS